MTISAAEFFEAGMALPPSVRRDLALRLLDSVEDVERESVDDVWTKEISSRVHDILSGGVEMVPGDKVFAELADRRAARNA